LHNLEQTIRECQQGNALAWEALIKRYQGKVYGMAYYFLRDKGEAEDASQETFIKVYRKIETFRSDQDSFVPWLLTIARNCCIDRLRKSKTQMKTKTDAGETTAEIAVEPDGPESTTSEQQRKQLLYQALDQFSQENKDVLMLKDIQGLKNEEVAEILSMPVGTVKSRSNRARIKLAKMLSSLGQFKIKQSGSW
jgi:RNA polymerase sigma-70 factor (ECF subfamily)